MKQYKNHKGIFCGWLSDDKIYRKQVDSKRHKFNIMDAYGIDKRIVDDLRNELCTEIRIKEIDTNIILSISLDDFLEYCVLRNMQNEQLFVSVKYFSSRKNVV